MNTFFSMLLGLLLLTGVSSGDALAQAAKSINVGVVNGKATRLPKPDYPQALRDAGIEGMVAVNVVINESGEVIFAEADVDDQGLRVRPEGDAAIREPVVTDPQLRTAAENAAREAKFAPTVIAGVPVQVKGKIVYNFVAALNMTPSGMGTVTSGGVLNGKAISLALPEYPAAAKAVKAAGAVTIQVTIDEEGNVISAAAISGHPLLRSSAEAAARLARFAPASLNGQMVKVSGVLTYNFVP